MTFYELRQDLALKQCRDRVKSIFGNEAQCKAAIYNWLKIFYCGYQSISNNVREGRARSTVTSKYIDTVRKLIGSDRHVTYDEIETTLNILRSRVHLIIHYHLKMKKICYRRILNNLSRAKKGTRVK